METLHCEVSDHYLLGVSDCYCGWPRCDLYWDNRSIGRCTAQLAFIGHFSSAVWQSTIKQQVFRNSAVVPLGNDF